MVKLNTSQTSTGSKIGDPGYGNAANSKEYFWGATLTKESPEATWCFQEEEDDIDFMIHTLFLRQAVLGVGAVSEDRNIIQVETKDFNEELLKTPIASLTLGVNDMCNLDMNFCHEIPVTFRLVAGSGPVHLSAQHLVEFPAEEVEEFDYTEGENTEDEDLDEEEEEEEESTTPKKRKAAGSAARKAKRGKLDSSANSEHASEEDEESMEEDDEDEEEEEDEDDDGDEEESEEETPEKKKKKGKAKGKKEKAKDEKSTKKAGKAGKKAGKKR